MRSRCVCLCLLSIPKSKKREIKNNIQRFSKVAVWHVCGVWEQVETWEEIRDKRDEPESPLASVLCLAMFIS
jgi:hypothetical protein